MARPIVFGSRLPDETELRLCGDPQGKRAIELGISPAVNALALAEAGVAPERCAVVRRVPPDRWALVVAALLDGVALVVADPPPRLRAADARRLVARARERAAMLVVTGPWPADAALRLHAEGSAWSGLGAGSGALGPATVRARLESRAGTRRAALDPLALGA